MPIVQRRRFYVLCLPLRLFFRFVSAVLAIIDIIKIVIGKFTDGEGRVITEWT